MELTHVGFLEELLAPIRGDTNWNNISSSTDHQLLFPINNSAWNFDSFDDNNPALSTTFNPSFSAFPTPNLDHRFECPYPFVDGDEYSSVPLPLPSLLLQPQQDEGLGFLGFENNNTQCCSEEEEEERICSNTTNNNNYCKAEEQVTQEVTPVFNMGLCCGDEKKKPNKSKKIEGQPSKNLMAERRRRKRLNDRLSMLRSIVPKISKMDRTSILGDTIDYMKELLEKVEKLQEEMEEKQGGDHNQITLLGISKEVKPNEVTVRNSPKFDVERKEQDTKINICCATKPGLLLSTVNTLEALGLEIRQCVISSFNDFSMQASCSEVGEQRTCNSSEGIKEALFRNAGYGGRCL